MRNEPGFTAGAAYRCFHIDASRFARIGKTAHGVDEDSHTPQLVDSPQSSPHHRRIVGDVKSGHVHITEVVAFLLEQINDRGLHDQFPAVLDRGEAL